MASAEIGGVGQHGRMIKIKRENAGEISAETGIGKPEGHSSCPREKVNKPENGLPLLFMSFSLSIVNVPVFFARPFLFLLHKFPGVLKNWMPTSEVGPSKSYYSKKLKTQKQMVENGKYFYSLWLGRFGT